MEHRTQVELIERLLAHIDAGTTAMADDLLENPVEIFTSPEKLALEQRDLFRGYPQAVGLSCRLPGPNTFFVDDHSGVPLLLTRDRDGVAHAFLNVCRHRGARVADGEGSCERTFICPYHGWTYRADGALVGIPDRESFQGLQPGREALTSLPLEERDGILWVSLDPSVPLNLDQHLGALGAEIASYDLASHHLHESRILRRQMNWKIAVDTFLEPYHFAPLHKTTVAPLLISNLSVVDGFGRNLREIFARHSITSLRDKPRADWDLLVQSAVVYLLFPNTLLIYQIDRVEFWRIYPVPEQPNRCVVCFEFYIPEPAVSESAKNYWAKNVDLTIRTVETEDFPTGEGIQQSCNTGAQTAFVYGRNEPALQYFHRQLRDAHDAAVA